MPNKIIGTTLIAISIVIVIILIPGLSGLKRQLIDFIAKYKPGFPTGEISVWSIKQVVGWIIAFFLFKIGIGFYKSGQKPS